MRIAIIGGGCAGVLQAIALLRSGRRDLDIQLIEPAAALGEGVAYATQDPLHLLNVPAERLGAHGEQPGGFLDWIREHRDDAVAPGTFAPRMRYGVYLRDALDVAARESGGAPPEHLRSRVRAITADEGGVSLELDDGLALRADVAVLAVGAPPPLLPTPLAHLHADADVYVSPWASGALDPIDGDVLLVGTGLTAVDAVLTLGDASASVRITAVSRSGLTPHAHRPAPSSASLPAPRWPQGATTLDELEQSLRRYIESAIAQGAGWREAFDSIRTDTPQLWQQLPPVEQTRFLRERMREWDVHRHRMAPAVAQRWQRLIDDGRIRLHASALAGVERDDASLLATFTDPLDGKLQLGFDRIIACTGPGSDVTRWREPLIQQLLTSGRASADVHGLGIRADDRGAVVGEQGVAEPRLRVLGSLRRGELWESTAVAEIRAQAQRIAETL